MLPRNWSMWLWTDEDNRELIARDFPSFLPLYDGYDVKIKRIDAVRYFYLYKYGGVYMDLDVMCLHPLPPPPLSFHPKRVDWCVCVVVPSLSSSSFPFLVLLLLL